MRRASRRDENEAGIVTALESAGCSVWRLSMPGVTDLIVGHYRTGTHLLEVLGEEKRKRYRSTGGLTPEQVKWHAAWKGPVHIVETQLQALEAVGLYPGEEKS